MDADLGAKVACAVTACLLLWWGWAVGGGIAQLALTWVALSLLLGPFAPARETGGCCTVGRGRHIKKAPPPPQPAEEEVRRRRRDPSPIPEEVNLQLDEASEAAAAMVENADGGGWSEADDRALLAALRTFPKDVESRWDKIAGAMPGNKPKADCFRRYSQLRDGFRNAKMVRQTGGDS